MTLGQFPGADREWPSRAERDDAYDSWAEGERQRVALQRSYFDDLPPSKAKDDLMEALLARAWDLLSLGEACAADQILEFVPAGAADALLARFFRDEDLPNPDLPQGEPHGES